MGKSYNYAIGVSYPDNKNYIVYDVPDLKEDVHNLFELRKSTL